MWVFGGRAVYPSCVGSFAGPEWTVSYTNSLWCYMVKTHTWMEVRASGITPSPRADMGEDPPTHTQSALSSAFLAEPLSKHNCACIHCVVCDRGSLRCPAGLAVAENGRRVYIVGGRFGLGQSGPSKAALKLYDPGDAVSILAEVFELDLGTRPLVKQSPMQDLINGGTGHWRQVRQNFRMCQQHGPAPLHAASSG